MPRASTGGFEIPNRMCSRLTREVCGTKRQEQADISTASSNHFLLASLVDGRVLRTPFASESLPPLLGQSDGRRVSTGNQAHIPCIFAIGRLPLREPPAYSMRQA